MKGEYHMRQLPRYWEVRQKRPTRGNAVSASREALKGKGLTVESDSDSRLSRPHSAVICSPMNASRFAASL